MTMSDASSRVNRRLRAGSWERNVMPLTGMLGPRTFFAPLAVNAMGAALSLLFLVAGGLMLRLGAVASCVVCLGAFAAGGLLAVRSPRTLRRAARSAEIARERGDLLNELERALAALRERPE
jgi:hypothetical protein